MEIKRRRQLVAAIFIFVLLFVFLSSATYINSQKGTVTIELADRGSSQNNVTFNNQSYANNSPKTSYTLRSGKYNLVIKKNGYNNFSANFILSSGQNIIINAILRPTQQPIVTSSSALPRSSTSIISLSTLPLSLAQDTVITDVHYFYNNSWAVIDLDEPSAIGMVSCVAQFNASQNNWRIITQPNDLYLAQDVASMPSEVANYINTHYAVNGG